MDIEVTCPNLKCLKKQIFAEELGGMKLKCAQCGILIEIPKKDAPAPPPAPTEPAKADIDPKVFLRHVRFEAVSQPIHSLEDGNLQGHEYLSRLVDRTMEPDEFFRYCQDGNILTSVDYKCFQTCLKKAEGAKRNLQIHINLFPGTLLEIPVNDLLDALPSSRPKQNFCIEIDQDNFPEDPVNLARRCNALRRAGVRIGLNNVRLQGDLDTVSAVKPDTIKLERSLAGKISEEQFRLESFKQWIDNFNPSIMLVAVGIESEEQVETFKELGIRFGQGYYWGEPGN